MMANEYKGMLKDFPREVLERMLFLQEEAGSKRDVRVFENRPGADKSEGGFDWNDTPEGYDFWYEVVRCKSFDIFFMKYPRQRTAMAGGVHEDHKPKPENVFIPLPEKMMEVWSCDEKPTIPDRRVVFGKKIIDGRTWWYAWSNLNDFSVIDWRNAAEIPTKTMTREEAERELSDRMNEIIKIEG
jgi:hypothetical protein